MVKKKKQLKLERPEPELNGLPAVTKWDLHTECRCGPSATGLPIPSFELE
jgi:hypothetical protein